MRHYTILLIDYEPRSIERTRRPLTDAGFVVHVATDGVTGLAAFLEKEPDLVILEAMLPKKHGFEVCQEIKRTAHGKRTPVFVQTAVYKGRKYRSQAMHIYGADEYLEKPYTEEFLIETVRTRLGIPPGEKISPPTIPVDEKEAEGILEILDPDRPSIERSPEPVKLGTGTRIPSDPDHPAEDEISRKLDDLFAFGGDLPVGDATSRTSARVATTAAPALAVLPETVVDPGPDRPGEVVDFAKHRARRTKAAPAPAPIIVPIFPPAAKSGGLPVWVWAALVGSVILVAYAVFARSL
jgi:DNA-binding response OmpR family regulator